MLAHQNFHFSAIMFRHLNLESEPNLHQKKSFYQGISFEVLYTKKHTDGELLSKTVKENSFEQDNRPEVLRAVRHHAY